MSSSTQRIVRAFKYQPKENKQSKVDRLMKLIREATGLSRSVSEDIADAVVRGREVERLAVQKGWPFEDGAFEGPSGIVELSKIRATL